jgi:CheY-like chemotaxis protein
MEFQSQQTSPVEQQEKGAVYPAPEQEAHLASVLVIDDDETARDLMRHFLSQEGFQVVTAASGEEGLHLARLLTPDVITLDVMMPRMDGWAVLVALQEAPELADTPIIMTTIVDDKNMGFALGATDYIMKPIDRSRLVTLVRKYQSAHATQQTGQILVTEDDAITRELLRRTLEQEGWIVHEAYNGHQALALLRQSPPDLILLDLMMPDMDGFEVVRTLRLSEEWRNIPIVVITAKELTPTDRQQLHGSVERILQKGAYNRDELLHEVRNLVLTHTRTSQY